jgi:hypothetical protein
MIDKVIDGLCSLLKNMHIFTYFCFHGHTSVVMHVKL